MAISVTEDAKAVTMSQQSNIVQFSHSSVLDITFFLETYKVYDTKKSFHLISSQGAFLFGLEIKTNQITILGKEGSQFGLFCL